MQNKGIAIITGASKGIGACVANGLAADGFKTVLVARNEERLRAVAEEITDHVPAELKPEYLVLDVTDHEKVTQTVRSLTQRPEPISVLVNNAGIWIEGTLDQSAESFEGLLKTNMIAPFVFMKEVAKTMQANGGGHIFNVASRAGKYGFAGAGLYSASKFGLLGLSESLYREFAEFKVKVTAICPGWVNTGMAVEGRAPIEAEEMIQPADILHSIRYVLGLSGATCIRELVIESAKSVL